MTCVALWIWTAVKTVVVIQLVAIPAAFLLWTLIYAAHLRRRLKR